MIWLYRLLFPLALVLMSPRYLRRMKRRGGYRENFGERFGRTQDLPAKGAGVRRIWIQAVSVGEMLAIGPILEALRREEGTQIYLTTTTSTGYRLARERYLPFVAGIGYFPLDWWPFSRRAWRRVDPDLVILTEGERWPEFIHQAARRRVPLVAINARLSDRSFRRMRPARALLPSLWRGMSRVLASSSHDADRFRELGMPPGRVAVTGNLKLDVTIPLLGEPERTVLRRELGLESPLILLGSSTWPGEEEALLTAWRAARDAGLAVDLLLVPRHAERRAEIAALLGRAGCRWHLRSEGAAPGRVDIAVADTTGELRKLTQLADVVFVGKSLPPHTEGQTPVEAAALHKAVLVGPGMANFRPIAAGLVAANAARIVADAPGLSAAVVELLRDPAARGRMSEAAARWHRDNQGAVERTLQALRAELARIGRDGSS